MHFTRVCSFRRKYKRTGRWEAHIWQSRGAAPNSLKKGRQVHLGSFNDGDRAAQCASDLNESWVWVH